MPKEEGALHDYAVVSVRGPRGVPEDLYAALLREAEKSF